jgi:hypothetical protein
MLFAAAMAGYRIGLAHHAVQMQDLRASRDRFANSYISSHDALESQSHSHDVRMSRQRDVLENQIRKLQSKLAYLEGFLQDSLPAGYDPTYKPEGFEEYRKHAAESEGHKVKSQ